jgi:hypothetical protein
MEKPDPPSERRPFRAKPKNAQSSSNSRIRSPLGGGVLGGLAKQTRRMAEQSRQARYEPAPFLPMRLILLTK